MLEKLAFWKKPKDELAPLEVSGLDQPPLQPFQPEQSPFGTPMQGLTSPPPIPQPPSGLSPLGSPDKDIQLISAKLDTIKALLENLNQRVANLERIAAGVEEQPPRQQPRW